MKIDWNVADGIVEAGFEGFVPMRELQADPRQIPDVRGAYMLIRTDENPPSFVATGTGGYFKGKDPNVLVEVLQKKWLQGATVVYIGKAGDPGSRATLRKRLRQYLQFGAGKNVGHWGGRYVWQLQDAEELVVCWLPLPDGHPSAVESALIESFRSHYGERPFANLRK